MSKEQDHGAAGTNLSKDAGATDPAAGCAGLGRERSGRLLDVHRHGHRRLILPEPLAWFEQTLGEIVEGGAYLLVGAPGSRKSGLCSQLAVGLGLLGVRTLTLLTEESPARLLDRALRMTGDLPRDGAERALAHMYCDDGLCGIEQLPAYLSQHVLSPAGRYHGTSVLFVDSIQGDGIAAGAVGKYARLYEALRTAKSAGITAFLVGHVTKRNQISGPRDLEHAVDACLVLRKVMDMRVLFVSKNRFGPEQLKGLPLVIDPVTTVLRPSPHMEPVTGVARTFLGAGLGAGELQGMVSLPAHNSKPQIQAPGLPRRRIEQLLSCIAQVPGLNSSSFNRK